jgi:hypothetical protein
LLHCNSIQVVPWKSASETFTSTSPAFPHHNCFSLNKHDQKGCVDKTTHIFSFLSHTFTFHTLYSICRIRLLDFPEFRSPPSLLIGTDSSLSQIKGQVQLNLQFGSPYNFQPSIQDVKYRDRHI